MPGSTGKFRPLPPAPAKRKFRVDMLLLLLTILLAGALWLKYADDTKTAAEIQATEAAATPVSDAAPAEIDKRGASRCVF